MTRTTLREVLQRLARDGWLTIQHGKPTKVNNFWETSGLNILETLARLDQDKVPDLGPDGGTAALARTNICTIFIRGAIRNNPEQAAEILRGADDVENTAEAYADFDYRLHHQLSFASGNPIYALILNGFKGLVQPGWPLLLLRQTGAGNRRCLLQDAAGWLPKPRITKPCS